MPKISVIMPTYNAEKYLQEAINSILEQTFADFELLIVDDNSQDNTKKIISLYEDKRIKLIEGPCKGIAAALNKGIEVSKGEYIARMDADDISLPERLEIQLDFLMQNPNISLCSTPIRFFTSEEELHIEGIGLTPEEVKIKLLFKTPIFHPTVMFRKRDFVQHQLYYNTNWKAAEDYELWSRVVRELNAAVLDKYLLKYRTGNVKACTTNADLTRKNHAMVIRNNFDYIGFPITDIVSEVLDPYNACQDISDKEYQKSLQIISRLFYKLVNFNKTKNFYDSFLLKEELEKKLSEIQKRKRNYWIYFGPIPIIKIKQKQNSKKFYLFGLFCIKEKNKDD